MKNLLLSISTLILLSFSGISQTVGVEIFINEIHYDNSGSDVGEGVEIVGPAGYDVSSLTLTLYNGNGGASYNTTALTGIFADEGNGYGTLCFSIAGIQNGAPDGIALSDGAANVMFLSYEGSFMATNGPALGMTSTDIMVAESSATPIGESLQLTGTGTVYADFTWNAPTTATPCTVNVGQNFLTGCDTYASITEIECATYTSPSGNYTWTMSGIYQDTIPNMAACDSILTIDLTINPTYNENATHTICAGDSYTFGTQILTTAGMYVETFSSINGCDSIVNLDLSVVTSYNENITATICSNETYTLGTQTLSMTGMYSELFMSSAGCDSTVNLDLTVLPTSSNSITEVACDSYTSPSGNYTWTMTGIYNDTVPAANGCDSVITVDLTINTSDLVAVSASACDSYLFEGNTYTSTGIYQVVLTNAAGCDSIRELTLQITDTPAAPVLSANQDLCDGDTPTDLMVTPPAPGPGMIISGIADGPLPGGLPKCIEFYIIEDIADMSIYGFGSANNGGGTDGEEFTFPAIPATAGSYYRVGTDSTNFLAFYGVNPENTDAFAGNVNGDDAIELFMSGAVIDVYGDIDTDGTGEAWEYLDGWAYRADGSQPNGGVFNLAEWSLSGINALDGEATNATAATPFPIGIFNTTPLIITNNWYDDAGPANFLGTSATYTPSSTVGLHDYYVTAETNGCESAATQVDVTINALPSVVANATSQLLCEGEGVTLTGSNAVTYTWDNGVIDGTEFYPTASGTYTVTGIDANGCSNTDAIGLNVLGLPTVTYVEPTTMLCEYEAAITLSGESPSGGVFSGTGVSGNQFDPSGTGGAQTITYTYTDGNGCSNSATSDITVDACLGLDPVKNTAVKLYPNPTQEFLSVEFDGTNGNVTLIDLTGKTVLTSKVNNGAQLNLDQLASGQYLITLEFNGQVFRDKVIVE